MKKKRVILFVRGLVILFPAFIFLSLSCNDSLENNNSTENNEVIIEWNNVAYTIAKQHDQFLSFTGVRALSMTHIAMHDALNAITPKYQPYTFKDKRPDADAVAACSQAAFQVLLAIYPERQDTLQKELQRWLSTVKDDKPKNIGIELGKKSSAAILTLRSNDGNDANADYHPTDKLGSYQYTPGVTAVWRPDGTRNKPFALKSTSQFRSPAPPPLNSAEYGESFNEVKAYGHANSEVRSVDQTNYAHWWAEFGEHGWNRIGRITAAQKKLPLWETARLFAFINMNLYDIYLASFDSKYYYDTWRPYTAIRNADKDDNPSTTIDAGWLPEMQTPPWPEYPSAHASVGAGEAEIVSLVYGTHEVSFEMESVTALPTAKTRSYNNLDSAANECAKSRIMNGFHFRFSTEEGKVQGRKVAQYIFSNFLKPVK